MKILIIILLIFLTPEYFFSQKKISVKILVNTVEIKEGEKIFITGNDSLLGNWAPSIVAMDSIDENKWEKNFIFNLNDLVEFKFTRGSWDTEAVNKDGSIPINNKLIVEKDTTLIFNIGFWKEQFQYEIGNKISGKYERLKNITGKGVKPRDVIIWFPPGYNKDTTKYFPVLYMHDGQNVFDPTTASFGYEWRLDEIADSLISAGKIEEIIIVGIYNTERRNTEYGISDSGSAYLRFIAEELKPKIDSLYRTKSNRDNTATGGASLGGLVAFRLGWEYPEIFSKVIAVSPAFNVDDINYIPFVEKEGKKLIKIYIDNGGKGIEERLQPGVDEMISMLLSKGYEYKNDLLWFFDKKGEHTERDWSKRIFRPLIFLFGK